MRSPERVLMSQKKVELKKTQMFFTHFCKVTSEDEENKKIPKIFAFSFQQILL
jgi:hypothetical protein